MHQHLAYPTVLPFEDVMSVVNGVRNGTLVSQPQIGVKALWELAGYAALMSVGEPSDTLNPTPVPNNAIHTSMAPVPETEILEHLEEYAMAQRDSNPDVVRALNIPWAMVLKWAVQILEKVVLTA